MGHVRYLREARLLGDALVVGLNSDASVRAIVIRGAGEENFGHVIHFPSLAHSRDRRIEFSPTLIKTVESSKSAAHGKMVEGHHM